MRRVLFISNGHGEDMVGSYIAKALKTLAEDLEILAFPLVGKGGFYANSGFRVVSPTKMMPSGGFLHQSLSYFLKDLASGLPALTLRQMAALRNLRGSLDLAVGIGDGIPLLFNSVVLRRPMVFVGIAKSSRYRDGRNPYNRLECAIMHRYCRRIIVRDPETRAALRRRGIPALYMGNPMMDCGIQPGPIPQFLKSKYLIGILPGSREEAYGHIEFLIPVVKELSRRLGEDAAFAFALADPLDMKRITGIIDSVLGAQAISPELRSEPGDVKNPSILRKSSDGRALATPSVAIYPLENGSTLVMAKGLFGEILSASTLVIGLSGTGNEQAAGMGKPIITFPGKGPQVTERFVREQKKLLGDALTITSRDPQDIANEVVSLLRDSVRREKMGQEGRRLMEGHGSCKRIAASILEVLNEMSGN